MPSIEERPRSLFGPKSRVGLGLFSLPPILSASEDLPTTPLPTTPLPATNSQLDLRDTAILPAPLSPPPPVPALPPRSPRITRQLSNPGMTGQLSNPGTMLSQSGLAADGEESAESRRPVVIKGEMKKRLAPPLSSRSRKKRRLLVSVSGVLMLVVVTAFALLSASPLGRGIGLNFSAPSTGANLVAGNGRSLSLVSQATATAVSHQQTDGYDPYSNGTVTISDGSGSLNWPVGQCTYWANYRYHELTGYWVSWTGNAAQWVEGARAAGWTVSTTPHIPSILVLMPYVQGAWGYGHVAVVENIMDQTSPVQVRTSNMNWWVNGGGWDIESTADFTVGPGVYFVWHS